MNYLSVIKQGLVIGLMMTLATTYTLADTEQKSAGRIVLSELEDGGTVDPIWCTIPAVEGRYPFGEVGGCRKNDYDLIMLDKVDSALTITIHDDRGCRDGGLDWHIGVRTVKQPTTTGAGNGGTLSDWIYFDTIWTKGVGSVIVPGVVTSSAWSHNGEKPDLRNGASCLDVKRL